MIESGDLKAMQDVNVGDRVQCDFDKFCDVFVFLKKDTDVITTYVRMTTSTGTVISASPHHYIYVNSKMTAAGVIQVGDQLTDSTGASQVITSVDIVQDRGAFNPHTTNGKIFVNGVMASAYTTYCHPLLARFLLLPFQALYNLGLKTTILDSASFPSALNFLAPRGPSALTM